MVPEREKNIFTNAHLCWQLCKILTYCVFSIGRRFVVRYIFGLGLHVNLMKCILVSTYRIQSSQFALLQKVRVQCVDESSEDSLQPTQIK